MPFASLLLAADSATTVPLTAALDNPVGQMYPMIATVAALSSYRRLAGKP